MFFAPVAQISVVRVMIVLNPLGALVWAASAFQGVYGRRGPGSRQRSSDDCKPIGVGHLGDNLTGSLDRGRLLRRAACDLHFSVASRQVLSPILVASRLYPGETLRVPG